MSQEALAGLSEPQAGSECTSGTAEDLLDEPRASNLQDIAGDQCERTESENDEHSHSGKYVSRSKSESALHRKHSSTVGFI